MAIATVEEQKWKIKYSQILHTSTCVVWLCDDVSYNLHVLFIYNKFSIF